MKQRYKRLAVLLLAVVMLATTASFTGTVAAESLNLDKKCSLTVNVGKHTGLTGTDLFIDVIKIADAVKLTGFNTYTFKAVARYESFQSTMDDLQSNDEWAALAQSIAAVALADGNWDESAGGNYIGRAISNLTPGLYLVVPHEENDRSTQKGTHTDGSTYVSTSYNTERFTYTFNPSLVSLPARGADAGAETPGDEDSWSYNVGINLKAEQDNRMGKLVIQKTLRNYEVGRPATFVFRIEAELPKMKDGQPVLVNGKQQMETVYSNVVTITLENAGTVEKEIPNIPVGATVTVTEVYSGACYELVSENDQVITISAEMVASVEFVNEYNESMNNGGGITNSFTFDGESWTLEKIPFGSSSDS